MSYEPPPQSHIWSWQWKKWLAGFHAYFEDRGKWTPVYEGQTTNPDSITYSFQVGEWIRRGNQVTVWFYIGTSSVTIGSGAGDLRVTGLPFPCSSTVTPNYTPIAAFNFAGDDTVFDDPRPAFARISGSSNYLEFEQADGTTNITATATYLATGASSNRINGTITYPV